MKDIWDVIVIGGGPAGMMAAGTAASRGLSVLLLEKNPTLGKKLRITGGGRCNITNATFDNRSLLANYGEAAKYLFSTFTQHDVKSTLDFFKQLNLITKTEAENRVFPVSDQAEEVAEKLEKFLATNQVMIRAGVTVKKIFTDTKVVSHLQTNAGMFYARNFILASGGTSRPETGSTGDGYKWLTDIGHQVIWPTPSLVPIVLKDTWLAKVAGLSLPKATIAIYQNEHLIRKSPGKILFTHNGLSGPGILNLSANIGEALEYGTVNLKINLLPEKSEEELIDFLKSASLNFTNKKIKNVLEMLVPAALAAVILDLSNIDDERKYNSLTRNERHTIILNLRSLTVSVDRLLGPDKAVVASGGLVLSEIDFKTMSSRLFKNLYVIGDLLNINRPSGGYSLQLCWTTGFVAGKNCLKDSAV